MNDWEVHKTTFVGSSRDSRLAGVSVALEIDMPDSPAVLAKRLESEGYRTYTFFSALTDDKWRREVYTEGATWSVRSILAHYVTAERGLVKLFEQICRGGAGASEDFSIDLYNARQQEKTRGLTPAELLEQFKSVRTETIAWVSTLHDSDLERQGRHPFLGVTSLYEMIRMIYVHNQIHLRNLRKVLHK